jgi:CBS domain-containing protein
VNGRILPDACAPAATAPFDLHGLKTYDLNSRPSKVFVEDLGRPVGPDATVAEALAMVRNPELPVGLASMVFVCRPPSATPTGRYLGCVHIQRLLREAPSSLVAAALDTDLASLPPTAPLTEVTRYFAAYNLVCGPVLDDQEHLVGAVTVDDVLDHLLPDNWRESGLPDSEDSATAGKASANDA